MLSVNMAAFPQVYTEIITWSMILPLENNLHTFFQRKWEKLSSFLQLLSSDDAGCKLLECRNIFPNTENRHKKAKQTETQTKILALMELLEKLLVKHKDK